MSNRKELWSNPTQSHYKKTYEQNSVPTENECIPQKTIKCLNTVT